MDPDDPDLELDLDRLDRALGALRHDRFGFSGAPGRDLMRRGPAPAPPSSRAYRVLRFIDGQPAGTVTVGQVAEVLLCDMARASRVVHRMVDHGLLTVRGADDDGRQRPVELADAGRRVVAAAADRRRRHLRAATAGWPAEDVRTLARLVDRLNRSSS